MRASILVALIVAGFALPAAAATHPVKAQSMARRQPGGALLPALVRQAVALLAAR